MYVEHPYKFNDKFYAKVDGEFYEITKEVAKAMLSAYRNEIYRSRKWNPEDSKDVKRKTKRTEILDCVFSENVDGIGVEDLPDVMQRSVEDLVIMETEATELHKKIEKLSEQEQFIIKSIYFDGIKQVELAKLLGISKVRMSQKVNAILKKCEKCTRQKINRKDALNFFGLFVFKEKDRKYNWQVNVSMWIKEHRTIW